MQQQPSPSPWEQLPSELLAEIFSHLSPVQLERVRLTCHRWNHVVCDTPALMAQFELRFDSQSAPFNGDHHEQSKMAANVTGRYSVAHVQLGLEGPLWDKIGETIQRLTVAINNKVNPLIELLRMTPNLKSLSLDNCKLDLSKDYDSAGSVDFKLEHLSELNFHGEFVDLFCQICPNLEALNYQYASSQPLETDVMPLIRTTQATLQKLTLDDDYMSSDEVWNICPLDRLHLKELSLAFDWEDPWTEMERFVALISKQPALELLRLEPVVTGGTDIKHDDVLILVRELKQLKTLNLPKRSAMTAVVLDHIVEHGHSLERLQIQLDRSDILPEQLAQLSRTIRVRLYDMPFEIPYPDMSDFDSAKIDELVSMLNEAFSI
ncbi:hypothetical protein pipiens_013937 [Culex pipiens pipiens]|uniref:F-box domain-containing protein n=1 Tax=Culex pipiens pipiens TaxID=38569 RepID=A0ABD1CWF7_CULPP